MLSLVESVHDLGVDGCVVSLWEAITALGTVFLEVFLCALMTCEVAVLFSDRFVDDEQQRGTKDRG